MYDDPAKDLRSDVEPYLHRAWEVRFAGPTHPYVSLAPPPALFQVKSNTTTHTAVSMVNAIAGKRLP